MYTKNPQIRISLLDYSHFSINFSFDVLDGSFRQCPIYINMLTARSCTTLLLLWKKKIFLMLFFFSYSHQVLATRVLIFGSSPHCAGKCMANFMQCILLESGKHYGKGRSLNCQLIFNSVIQIHSFRLVRYYALIVLSSYGRRSRRTRLLYPKTISFGFLLFNYMLLSA